jgi:hypothetical protein
VVNINLEFMGHILLKTEEAYLENVLKKFNLFFSSAEELLDITLVTLSILSYALVKRGDLLQSLDKLILPNLEQFLTPQAPLLIRTRFCLFLSFYLDQLFTTAPRELQESAFERVLFFLLEALALPKDHKILSLQALDVLTTQVNDSILSLKI